MKTDTKGKQQIKIQLVFMGVLNYFHLMSSDIIEGLLIFLPVTAFYIITKVVVVVQIL